MSSRPSAATSVAGLPSISSLSIDIAACEIAQPWPRKRTASMRWSSVRRRSTVISSPHSGFVPSAVASFGSSSPRLRGLL